MERKTNFSLLVPFAQSNRRPAQTTPTRSISQVLAETTIKQHNLEYQQLLIRTKQLEIRMGELQAQLQGLQKRRIKADKVAEQEGQRKERAVAELKEKQCYLQRYYDELDRKFKGGKEQLFAGLKKLEQNLLEMYQRDERRIRESLQSERQELAKISDLVGTQRMQRDLLKQELKSLQRVKEVDYTGSGHTDKEELLAENHFLRGQIDRLMREKKTLETQQRNLKRILNIQQEHKKHGAIIAAGIRKMFGIRVKQQRYKEAVAQDYAKNISGLRDIISKRRSEKKALAAELAEKKSKLARLKEQNSSKNKQYGQLQDELFRLQRK